MQENQILYSLDPCPGTYLLCLHSQSNARSTIGKLGQLDIMPGFYLYVGSAFGPGGIRARLKHHLFSNTKPRWHLDYLRGVINTSEVWFSCDPVRREDLWSEVLSSHTDTEVPLTGFGASDRPAESHLFYISQLPGKQLFEQMLQKRAPKHAPLVRVPLV